MKLSDLKLIRESLSECHPLVEHFSWGPSLSMAEKRRETALKLIRRAIKETKHANALHQEQIKKAEAECQPTPIADGME